ncbi:MAG TPA: hypothetical protein VGM37_05045 [Armatimonadota bacterium]|jgi:hypothetical protein
MNSFTAWAMAAILLLTVYRLVEAVRRKPDISGAWEWEYYAVLAAAEALLIVGSATEWQWVVLFGVGASAGMPVGRGQRHPGARAH